MQAERDSLVLACFRSLVLQCSCDRHLVLTMMSLAMVSRAQAGHVVYIVFPAIAKRVNMVNFDEWAAVERFK
jgi:hypothetical protein